MDNSLIRTNRQMLEKVPQVIFVFWITKILTTAMGESLSDYIFFNDYIGKNAAMLIGLGFLIITLVMQFSAKKYIPWIYWLTVSAVSIFGTMSADFLNTDLGMPYYASTTMFLIIQSIIFIVWYASEKTLSVHSINTHRREFFYWSTVLCTFALGTAAGDFAADTLKLGTLSSGFIFLGLILIPAIGFKYCKWNEVFSFWFAYTLTRPLGASFSDWFAVPKPYGDGLGLGTGLISLVFGILTVIFVVIMANGDKRKKSIAKNYIKA